MLSSRFPSLRRLTALLLAIGLVLFTAETLIADVHDGGASGGAAQVKEAGVPAHAPTSPDTPARGDGHDVHVCHCIHPHGGMPALQDPLPTPFLGAHVVAAGTDVAPNDVGIAPPLRPPIG